LDKSKDDETLGLTSKPVTRRDVVNGVVVGSGAMLLGCGKSSEKSAAPSVTQGESIFDVPNSWQGYGGVGDCAESNGNIAKVVKNAHAIREGSYSARLHEAIDTEEIYELVVVGAGLSGLGVAYEFSKKRQA